MLPLEGMMADEDPNIEQFHTDEEALHFLKARADDIAWVGIPVVGPVSVLQWDQMLGPYQGMGMIVFMVSGDTHLMRPSRADLILNDGFLDRMRIKINLLMADR
jgi:hypothetical protein